MLAIILLSAAIILGQATVPQNQEDRIFEYLPDQPAMAIQYMNLADLRAFLEEYPQYESLFSMKKFSQDFKIPYWLLEPSDWLLGVNVLIEQSDGQPGQGNMAPVEFTRGKNGKASTKTVSLANEFLLVGQLKPNALDSIKNSDTLELRQTYQSIPIYKYGTEGRTQHLTLVDDIYYVCPDLNQIKLALDVALGAAPPLAIDEWLSSALEDINDTEPVTWMIRFPRQTREIRQEIAARNGADQQSLERFATQIEQAAPIDYMLTFAREDAALVLRHVSFYEDEELLKQAYKQQYAGYFKAITSGANSQNKKANTYYSLLKKLSLLRKAENKLIMDQVYTPEMFEAQKEYDEELKDQTKNNHR